MKKSGLLQDLGCFESNIKSGSIRLIFGFLAGTGPDILKVAGLAGTGTGYPVEPCVDTDHKIIFLNS